MSIGFPSPASLAARMRADWDRRVAQDYRFWMSDGVEDDSRMWEAGERDFSIIANKVPSDKASQMTALELGCGVGRLLRPASRLFKKVIGVDVSENAISQAYELLRGCTNVDLRNGNGVDLSGIDDESIDFAFTFAALCNMPVSVIAKYLCELSRVLKSDSILTAQVYLGQETCVVEEDTIGVRCFDRDRFRQAVEQAGFTLENADKLILPFEVSNPEQEIVAYIATLRKCRPVAGTAEEIAQKLCSSREPCAGEEWVGSEVEYAMNLERAQQHMDAGRFLAAKEALEMATANYKKAEPEIIELLARIRTDFGGAKKPAKEAPAARTEGQKFEAVRSTEIYSRNLSVMRDRFPRIASELEATAWPVDLEVRYGLRGEPVILFQTVALDQVEKPSRSGEVWSERALANPRLKNGVDAVIIGFAGGYHVESMCGLSSGPVHVVEPNLAILKAALALRDISGTLRKISTLHTTIESFNALVEERGETGLELFVHPQTQMVSREFVDLLKRSYWSVRGLKELRPSIAVVGPIYGGTLPISIYAANALKGLKQRTHLYDLGVFHKSYLDVEGFVKSKAKAGVLQSYYVEMLSQIVLEGVTERPVDIVVCLAQAPLSPRVLTELRNRGIITAMWFVEDCRRFKSWQEISRYYDYMFLIQRGDFLKKVEEAGAGRAVYLPVGCAPQVHHPLELSSEEKARWGSDISFVGAGYNNRSQMFACLAGRNFKIWGTEWPVCPPFDKLVQDKGRRISPEEYIKIFNASAINLNLHSSMERDGVEPFGDFVNPRTFELAACEAFQLLDNRLHLPENFDVGKEVITFNERREMEDKIDYYLAHPEERSQIAKLARARVLREHTYERRLQEMLGCIYADRFEELRARTYASPWTKTLEAAKPYPELHAKFEKLYEQGDEPTLNGLVVDVQKGKGTLSETEQKLLFLYHVKSQISYVNELREGKTI